MLYCIWIRSRTRTTCGCDWTLCCGWFLDPAAAAAIVRANRAAPAAFFAPVSPWPTMPTPAPAPTFFVPWKSATTEVGTIQYGTYRNVTCPRFEVSATFRRKTPLLSHFPPASRADSFESLLSSMKCFWNTWAAPPAPIVVTAPQYSHTTRARPWPGFSGPPHELHFMLCGMGGGVTCWTGAFGL